MMTIFRVSRTLGALLLALLALPGPELHAQTTIEVAEPFRSYYDQHQGIRVLGYPLTDLVEVNGYPAQYFEKGRIEDHRADNVAAEWAFMYGRLTAELIAHGADVRANSTNLTYADIARAADPAKRTPPPPGFSGGVMPVHDGMFVPYDPQLRPAPGYVVAPYFWAYMNRTDLFPAGWLHDIGLPMTDTFNAETVKDGETHIIFMQAFERTVLTYDMRNPAGWQVERGNIGADALGVLQAGGPIELPAAGAQTTLPLHVLARVGAPGGRMIARLRWQDGTELLRVVPVLRGEDGRGLVIDNLNWNTEGPPPQPPTQAATLELLSEEGDLQARQFITVLSADDPNTQVVQVYWVLGDQLQAVQRRVPATPRIGTAALEELLWGPAPPNLAGFTTAIPTPEQVLSYPGRAPAWGPRVTLRSLTIVNSVATADFSKELNAYGGGSTRVMFIRQQITRTLLQFPTISEVRIAIEGQTEGVLQP